MEVLKLYMANSDCMHPMYTGGINHMPIMHLSTHPLKLSIYDVIRNTKYSSNASFLLPALPVPWKLVPLREE